MEVCVSWEGSGAVDSGGGGSPRTLSLSLARPGTADPRVGGSRLLPAPAVPRGRTAPSRRAQASLRPRVRRGSPYLARHGETPAPGHSSADTVSGAGPDASARSLVAGCAGTPGDRGPAARRGRRRVGELRPPGRDRADAAGPAPNQAEPAPSASHPGRGGPASAQNPGLRQLGLRRRDRGASWVGGGARAGQADTPSPPPVH